MRRSLLAVAVVVGALVLASSALAATGKTVSEMANQKSHSAAGDQYGTPPPPVKPKPHPNATNTTQPTQPTQAAAPQHVAGAQAQVNSGTLPFTGFSLLATVAIGLALVGLGFLLRRRSSSE